MQWLPGGNPPGPRTCYRCGVRPGSGSGDRFSAALYIKSLPRGQFITAPPTNPLRGARYERSAHDLAQLPQDSGREVAFAGRSNAGKSSAINALTDHHGLAHTSKTPGRTQLLNFFSLDAEHRLVDLPGYGYARVPAEVKRHWDQLINDYLQRRRSLVGMVLVMDIRHPLTDFDRQLIQWCAVAHLPLHILLTKADKLRRGPALAEAQKVRRELASQSGEVTVQTFSALKKEGVEEARARIRTWLQLDAPSAPRDA